MFNLIKEIYAQQPGFNIQEQYRFSNYDTFGKAFSQLVVPAFSVAGIAVVLYFLVGAYKYIRSEGDKNEVAQARAMMIHGIIGLMMLALMIPLIQFIMDFFGVKIKIF